jgi:hypothetical protein
MRDKSSCRLYSIQQVRRPWRNSGVEGVCGRRFPPLPSNDQSS